MRTVDNHELTGSEFDVGDEVWVKPPGARCSTPWKPGVVTGVNSKYNISIRSLRSFDNFSIQI